MPLWALCLLVALSGVLDARSCSSFTCPAICRCSAHTLQCSRESQLASRPDNVSVSTLWLPHLPLTAVPTHAFKELINITLIKTIRFMAVFKVDPYNSIHEISMSDSITRIQRQAFLSLHSLEQISVQNINSLRVIEKAAFTDLPRLKYLEVMDNVRIVSIPANSFQGITEEYVDMTLVGNSIKEIKAHAFNGTKLNKLVLKDNGHLSDIHEDAFEGAIGPTSLERALENLPTFCDFFDPELQPSTDGVDFIDDFEYEYPDLELYCLTVKDPFIKCTPRPDAFNPCEDLLGFPFLRALTWIIAVFAVTALDQNESVIKDQLAFFTVGTLSWISAMKETSVDQTEELKPLLTRAKRKQTSRLRQHLKAALDPDTQWSV
ncbi:hypothetical protein F2P81_020105 [Scophthalmus maximus]|uniref:LRRNT domain-containing protein n=1 Tax=Scophthalmus maximus TaxID=52904 RepID=A0A6A4S9K9_SCOMX|nr:hypothetical protein F2P81_020105 [Scophthalmus maximus]